MVAGLAWVDPGQGAAFCRRSLFRLRNPHSDLSFDDFTKIKLHDRCLDKPEKSAIKASSGMGLIVDF